MKRGVMFAGTIQLSKRMAHTFPAVAENAKQSGLRGVSCETRHVDGSMGALERGSALSWLKSKIPDGECRILSNARCLTEGIDVPSLDAAIFISPRRSQVDVVQAVGRVMRKDPMSNKRYGYIILPVAIPPGSDLQTVLEKGSAFDVVWEVLNALRAHDERFEASVNRLDFHQIIVPPDQVGKKDPVESRDRIKEKAQQLNFDFSGAIYAKIVEKLGTKRYWETWAKDISDRAASHIARINAALADDPGNTITPAFETFLKSLHETINDTVTREEAVEMLAQHLLTRPVFEAVFDSDRFTIENPVSKALDDIVQLLRTHEAIDKEVASLDEFYESVRRRASGDKTPDSRQRLIRELYETFFQKAFQRSADRYGVVYTPLEIVDFINNSVEVALNRHFGTSLKDPEIHIIDPFVGTGTFPVRMMSEGLLGDGAQLEHKFLHELHANDISLMAYYISSVNIEQTYQSLTAGAFEPFQGTVLTDTFELGERDEELPTMMKVNSERANTQRNLPITVVVGNPPYRAGQENENDVNQNIRYPKLDQRIAHTYTKASTAKLKHKLYDSYVKAIRWASDRIGDSGVVAYVTNGSWLRGQAANGIRACLEEEFSDIYVVDLRGGQRTRGELSRKEGGKVFGQGSRVTVTIFLLVKSPEPMEAPGRRSAHIHYVDIGDYLSKEDKLAKLTEWKSIADVPWTDITPNAHHDWIGQRSEAWDSMIPFEKEVFFVNSNGLCTSRDAWIFNSSQEAVIESVQRTISVYEATQSEYKDALRTNGNIRVEDVATTDAKQISWSHSLKQDVIRGRAISVDPESVYKGLYRPFFWQQTYFNRTLNERVYQLPKLFPKATTRNPCILVSGKGSQNFSVLATDKLPCFDLLTKTRVFPRFTNTQRLGLLFEDDQEPLQDNITDSILQTFQHHYSDISITKDEIFSYLYGLLMHREYIDAFGDSLVLDLPRVAFAEDFSAVAHFGKKLMDLHIGFEAMPPYPLREEFSTDTPNSESTRYHAKYMTFPKRADATGRSKDSWERSQILVNDVLMLTGIPEEAWRYELNGRPVLELVAERYRPKVDKKSGIANDPNQLSDDSTYLVTLFKRVVTVCVDTVKLVDQLSKIQFRNS